MMLMAISGANSFNGAVASGYTGTDPNPAYAAIPTSATTVATGEKNGCWHWGGWCYVCSYVLCMDERESVC